MVKDSYKFMALGVVTAALMVLLVVGGWRKESAAGAGVRVDVKRIEQLAGEGKLGIRKAEFGATVESPEEP